VTLTETIRHAIWEEHVHSKDEVIEVAERILEPIVLAALAMRHSAPISQDAKQMWDEAVKEVERRAA
jgi:hypothetical protein